MEHFKHEISGQVTEDINDLTSAERELLKQAGDAMRKAYAPYSNFSVGAALRLSDGTVVCGNNQENAAFPSGLCAERVAFFAASSMYPGATITDVAITASSSLFEVDHPIAPCGACRQVMLEYELNQDTSIKLLLRGNSGRMIRIDGVRQLLPFFFHENGLRKS